MEKFKIRLRELMQGISVEQLAKNLNMNSSTIHTWFNSYNMPNLNNIIILSNYFECSIDYILGRTEDFSSLPAKECPPFHENLLKILNSRHLTKTHLRNKKIISSGLNESIFKKHSTLNIDSVIKIADYLNVSIDELVGRV